MKSKPCGGAASYLCCLLVAASLTGCDRPSGESGDASSAIARLDACEILANAGPEEILGEATGSGMLLVESHTDDASSSQCQFAATASDRTIGLLIQRARGNHAPKSREAYLDAVRNADDMGAGEEMVDVLQAGHEIPGLGDMALTYDLFTFNLMVWSGEYQLTVMLNGFGTGADAESRAVAAAKAVLAELGADDGQAQ